MEKLEIEKFKLKRIHNALRLVANNYGCRDLETSLDRQVVKALGYVTEILAKLEPKKEENDGDKI